MVAVVSGGPDLMTVANATSYVCTGGGPLVTCVSPRDTLATESYYTTTSCVSVEAVVLDGIDDVIGVKAVASPFWSSSPAGADRNPPQ